MANLNTIISDISTALKKITKTNGFAYDIGSVNPTDHKFRDEHKTYPSADITWDNDEADTDEANNIFGWTNCEIQIRLCISQDENTDLYPIVKNVPIDPSEDILDDYAVFLADVRSVLTVNSGWLVNTNNAVLTYKGSTKRTAESGDIFRPLWLDTKWNVRYQQLE